MTHNDIHSCYDDYVGELQKILPRIDSELVHNVIHLERKLQSESVSEPHVILAIKYSPNVNLEKKIYDLRETYALEVSNTNEENVVKAVSRMTINKLEKIVSDTSIISITGEASPVIRS